MPIEAKVSAIIHQFIQENAFNDDFQTFPNSVFSNYQISEYAPPVLTAWRTK
jgi:hypothetical protein